MGDRLKDLTGMRFGRWFVIERAPNKGKAAMWRCRCYCGTEKIVHGTSLKSGASTMCRSCSYLSRKPRLHGLSHHPLYRIWQRIKSSTTNPNHQDYEWYGGKGVRVCEEWFDDFLKFYEWSISNGYQPGLTIDRIEVNGDYEPSNCRWVPFKEQTLNRTDNVWLTHNGVTHTIKVWSQITGIRPSTLYGRYHKGWPPDKILSTCSYAKGGGNIDLQSS
jgi:hypothetical protein